MGLFDEPQEEEVGRKFWRKPGRKMAYDDPQELYEACLNYFDWVDDNPLQEEKAFSTGVRMQVNKARSMSVRALSVHLGITSRTWRNYKNSALHGEICEAAEEIIFVQKFEGACAGFFNSNIIARDLGLADKTEHSGPDGGPVVTSSVDLSDTELARRLAHLLQAGVIQQADGDATAEDEST